MEFENKKDSSILKLYDRMSSNIISNLKQLDIDPNDVALDAGMTSERMLEILFDNKKGDYLAYKEVDTSIKKLSKKIDRNIDR